MTEEWRPVIDWVGYEVSNLGRVRSIDRSAACANGLTQMRKGQMLSPRPNGDGYLVVTLRTPGRHSVARVHRLVAKSFIPNPESKPHINHIDCVVSNNDWRNLEWCTQAENLAHMTTLGRRKGNPLGVRSVSAKLDDYTAMNIRAAHAEFGYSYSQLAAFFGTNKRTIGRILSGQSYAPGTGAIP